MASAAGRSSTIGVLAGGRISTTPQVCIQMRSGSEIAGGDGYNTDISTVISHAGY